MNNGYHSVINSIVRNQGEEIYNGDLVSIVTYSNIEGGHIGEGNIDVDPLFVDQNESNYRLLDYSPCIGGGALPGSPNYDLDGNPRSNPQGSNPDMGAYENPLATPAHNSMVYVSPSGSDDGSIGLDSYPFASIQTAIDYSLDGDTVLVHPGTYVENINFNGKNIVVGSLFLTTEDTSYISQTIIDGNQSGSTIIMSGNQNSSSLVGFGVQNGLNTDGGGIQCRYAHPLIDHCMITNNSAGSGAGISLWYSNAIISNCIIKINSGSNSGGLLGLGGEPILKNLLIFNNQGGYGSGVKLDECDMTIINSTIVDNSTNGIYAQSNSSLIIINSVLYGNGSSSDDQIVNAGCIRKISYSLIQGGYNGLGNIGGNPWFVDSENNNYYLQNYSPCIGTGLDTTIAPSIDLEGNPRPNPTGSNPDMGAYENPLGEPVMYLEVQNLDIGGNEDILHLVNHMPAISFTYFNDSNEAQTDYQLQVSSSATFEIADIWDTGSVGSADTSVNYSGNVLEDGQTYYLRARVASGDFWSDWSTLQFRMNSKPSIPVLISPINNEISGVPVILNILNSTDAENDNLTYSFNVYGDAVLTEKIDSVTAVMEATDTTSWQIITTLIDNGQYWWTASANDGYEESTVSNAASFLLNSANDAPNAFALLSPADSADVITLTPLLDWEASFDPDPLDTVSYNLYFGSLIPDLQLISVNTSTSYQIFTPLSDNTVYYWKVIAKDLAGATTENDSGFYTFKVNTQNDAPDDFDLIFPEDGSMVITHSPLFYWQVAEDIDPQKSTISINDIKVIKKKTGLKSANSNVEPVKPANYAISDYLFYINDSNDFTSVSQISVDTNCYRIETPLKEDKIYYWKVKAIGNIGEVTSSEIWSFWTNKENSPPDTFNIIQPQPGEVLKGVLNTFIYAAAKDPDINDEVNYMVYLGTSIEDIQLVYDGPILDYAHNDDLSDNTKYYLSVVAKDKSGATRRINGDYIDFYINIGNDAPSAPVPISPDSCAIRRMQVKLDWAASVDPDPLDTVTYQVVWQGEWENNLHSIESDTNSVIISEDRENWKFFWYVISKDKNGGESQSETVFFWLDQYPEEPNSFKTIYPENGATGLGRTIVFNWEKATDPDPFDATKYDFVYATDSDDSSTYEYIPEVYDTTFTMEFSEDGIYYWCITAHDRTNLMTTSNDHQLHVFTIGNVGIDGGLLIPEEFALHSNYPNPFNPTTSIRYDIPKATNVTLTIYNMNGQVVEKLVNQKQEPGFYSVNWDAQNVSTGVYFYQLQTEGFQQVKKCLLIK